MTDYSQISFLIANTFISAVGGYILGCRVERWRIVTILKYAIQQDEESALEETN